MGRPDALRALQRGERPQGRDHQGRQQAPEEDAGRGRVALPDVLGAAEGPRRGPGPGPGRPEACRQGRAEAGREAGGAARARGPQQQGERGHGARARLLGMGGRPHGRGGVGGCSYSFVNWAMLFSRLNRDMLTPGLSADGLQSVRSASTRRRRGRGVLPPGAPDRRPLGACPYRRQCAECSPSKFIGGPLQTVMGGPPHISQSPRKRFDPKPLRRTSGPFSASAQGATRVHRLSVRRRSLSRSNGLPSERSPRADIKLQRRASVRHAEVAADGLI